MTMIKLRVSYTGIDSDIITIELLDKVDDYGYVEKLQWHRQYLSHQKYRAKDNGWKGSNYMRQPLRINRKYTDET